MTYADLTTHGRRPLAPVLFAAVFACSLALVLALRPLGFVHHDTSEVVMWANTGLPAGFWKHPPFLPWAVHVWSWFAPLNAAGLAVLTSINTTFCGFAVWRLAMMSGGDDHVAENRGIVALLLLATVPYATFMAIKLNHNAILISLWPLTVLALLRALEQPTVLRGALFGLAGAAAVLAKYYSFLLLAGCLAASFANWERTARFYRNPAPYVAVALFAAALLPHVLWLLNQPMSPLGYAFSGGVRTSGEAGASRGVSAALLFLAGAPIVAAPMVVAGLLLARYGRVKDGFGPAHAFEREILIITAVPWLLTAAIAIVFNLRAPIPWALPVFLCLPAVLASRIGSVRTQVLRRSAAGIAIGLPLLALAGQIGVRHAIAKGTDGVADPRQEIALVTTRAWRDAVGTPLAVVGGDPRLTSGTVMFSPDHPQGWPSFSQRQAPWIDQARARSEGFAGLCRVNDAGCILAVETAAAGQTLVRCPITRRKTYLGAAGPPFAAVMFIALPFGRQPFAPVVCPPRD